MLSSSVDALSDLIGLQSSCQVSGNMANSSMNAALKNYAPIKKY